MLMSLRRSVNKSFVKYIIFGVLILSFGLWGVADLFIRSGGGSRVVFTAGDSSFSYAEVESRYRRELQNLGIEQYSTDRFTLQRVLDYTLERLAVSAMNSQQVKDLGIKGDRNSVLESIRRNASFYDGFGRFDSRLFQRFLAISGLTESEYIDLLAQDIGAQFWLASLQASLVVPKSLAEIYGRYLRRVSEISYVEIPYAEVVVKEPSDSDLQTYYNGTKENYRVEEERKFSLVDISPSSLATELSPTGAELRARYGSELYKFQTAERRDISFIVFSDSVTAQRSYESAQGGASFSRIALSEDLSVQSFTSQVRSDIADIVLADAAFSLVEVGEIAEVFEGTFGWILLRLDGVVLAETSSFASVRDVIVSEILSERTADLIYEKAQGLEDSVHSGSSLAEAAQSTGVGIGNYSSFDDVSLGIKSEAFLLGEGEISTLIEHTTADGSLGGFFMLELQSIIDTHIAEFAVVKGQIKEDYLKEQRIQALQTSRKDDLQEFATIWGGVIKQAEVSLNQQGADYPLALNSVEFRRNDIGYVDSFATEESFIVAQLSSVSLREAEEGQENVGERILTRLMQNTIVQAYESALRDKYKITRNDKALQDMLLGDESARNSN